MDWPHFRRWTVAYYCSATDVIERLSESGVRLRLDDRPEAIAQVLRRATNRVKAYCVPLYTADDLQADADAGGFVNDMATDLAVCELCRRRGNVIPASAKEQCKKVDEELEMVRRQQLALPGVELAFSPAPAFSNIRIMPGYLYKKARVEASISETTSRAGYVPAVDWFSTWFEY